MPLNTALQASASIPPLSWDALDIKGLHLVKSWSFAVGKALTGEAIDTDAIQLAGRACVVESQILNGATLGRSVADAAGLPYLTFDPGSEEFLAILNAIEKPTVVHLEQGPWQTDFHKVASQWKGQMPESVQAQLKRIQGVQSVLMNALQNQPLVYLTTTKAISTFSVPLQQVGGFDRQISLNGPVQEMSGALWLARLGDCVAPSLQDARVKVAGLMAETELDREGVILRLKRIASEENRDIELADFIDVLMRGTTEADASDNDSELTQSALHRVAWHEAGHALMTVLDSRGQSYPDYASACRSTAFGGVVVSISDRHEPMTYASLRHDVRVALAGRAAEELVYGSAHVSNGAANDLLAATRKCSWAFSTGGLAPGMDDAARSGSNLAVTLNEDAATLAEVRTLVQAFLATEYQHVLGTLHENRGMLDALGQRLMVDRIVDQAEMRVILDAPQGRLG
jgi:hypothetical protein